MGSRIPIKENKNYREHIITFKNNKDGTYTKQTKTFSRDRQSNAIKYYRKNNPVVEDGPFILVSSEEEYNETQTIQDFEGKNITLYFKKVNDKI